MDRIFEIAELAKKKGCILNEFHPDVMELIDWLCKKNIVVAVNYNYECDDTSFEYKIWQLNEKEFGRPIRQPYYGYAYDKEICTKKIVGYRDYILSYKAYKTYEDALYDGLIEALKMLENV